MEVIAGNGGCSLAANKELKELLSNLDEEKIKETTSFQKIKSHLIHRLPLTLTVSLK